MRGSRVRFAALAAVVAGGIAAPAAAEDSAPVPPSAEAWYASGVGTVVTPLRPEGTLHVGAAAGQETDRTFLRFDLAGTEDAEGIRLTVPVAVDDGTQAPETAELLVCAVAGTIADGGGGEAPEADCDGAPTATFVEGDAPAFTVDLPPPTGDAVQVALVPTGDGTWHVAFESREREGAEPATVVVSTSSVSPGAPTSPAFDVPPAAAPALPGTEPLALPDLAPASPGQAVADQAEAAPPTAVVGVPIGGRLPFRYPAVFGLPLVLLVVLGLAGDGLTKPVRL